MVFSSVAALTVALLLIGGGITQGRADEQSDQTRKKHHGLSLITKKPQLPAGFDHFPYANPEAPKGGQATLSWVGTFDNLNPITFKGNIVRGTGLVFEPLMTTSLDEASTEYGLIAEWVSYPDDYSSATFGLREEARWQDGKPITPEDVIFSLNVLKANNPAYNAYYANVKRADKTGHREVTFYFDVKNNRELPLIIGQLRIFPKHYWEGGEERNPSETTLQPPLGSGPYRIAEVEPGRFIVYERIKDYWAEDINVRKGHFNFDRIRYDYYRDRSVAFEAFKAGKVAFYRERIAKNWATGYDFPAYERGDVVKRKVSLDVPMGMQALIFNVRRDRFADPRVRRAFNYAFNFEWINDQIFFGQYKRTDSFFENSELAWRGLSSGQEREVLKQLREKYPDYVPKEVLTKEYFNPSGGDRRAMRGNLRKALELFREAGWKSEQGRLIKAQTGEQFTVEFLLASQAFERIVLPYKRTLERLGIKVSVRTVDTSQYQRRLDTFDFDITSHYFGQSESPGNEQRNFWGSKAATIEGSANKIGIQNPAIDELINKVIFAKNREELVAMTRALDRILLWNHYVVPSWFLAADRIAYWDKFGHPEQLPSRSVGFLELWWSVDERDKQASTKE